MGNLSAILNSEFFFLLAGNGVKKGLIESARTETADHGLGFRRDHKIGKSLSAQCIDSRTVSGVDFHHRINIKEHPDRLPREPGAAKIFLGLRKFPGPSKCRGCARWR